jgi:hypothetical protein
MVMDLRRTMFRERWNFGEASDTIGDVVWFDAPPGALFYQGLTPFRSLDWIDLTDLPAPGPGPLHKRQSRYTKGKTIPGYTGKGPVCGPADWWVNGVPSPPPPAPNRDDNGVPECCSGVATGAAMWSSAWKLRCNSLAPVELCVQCGQASGLGGPATLSWTLTNRPNDTLMVAFFWLPYAGKMAPPPGDWELIDAQNFEYNLGYAVYLLPSVPVDYDPSADVFSWIGDDVVAWSAVFSEAEGAATPPESPVRYLLGYPPDEIPSQPVSWPESYGLGGGALTVGEGVYIFAMLALYSESVPGYAVQWNFGASVWPGLIGLRPYPCAGIPTQYFTALIGCATIGATVFPPYASWTADFGLEWAGAPEAEGAAVWTADFQLDWTGAAILSGAAAWTADFQLDWTGAAILPGAAAWTADFQLDWTGAAILPGAAAWTADFQLDWTGAAIIGGAAAWTADLALDWTGAAIISGAAAWTAAFALAWTGRVSFTGSTTYTPPSNWTALVQCWGGGGGAGTGSSLPAKGGGGGGGYSATTHTFTGGVPIAITVGAGGAPGTAGGLSSVVAAASTVALANGGSAAVTGTGGAGASTTGAVGSTTNGGGTGGTISGSAGGGGGGAGGSTATGGNASGATAGLGNDGGGNGGAGGATTGANGQPGVVPGGGGGGKGGGSSATDGNGAGGLVTLG